MNWLAGIAFAAATPTCVWALSPACIDHPTVARYYVQTCAASVIYDRGAFPKVAGEVVPSRKGILIYGVPIEERPTVPDAPGYRFGDTRFLWVTGRSDDPSSLEGICPESLPAEVHFVARSVGCPPRSLGYPHFPFGHVPVHFEPEPEKWFRDDG